MKILILPLRKVTTVHKDVSERLIKINPSLAKEVRIILDENKAERHIRGGMATKLKYSHIKKWGKSLIFKLSIDFFFSYFQHKEE